MLCTFTRLDPHYVRCSRCGATLRTPLGPELCQRRCGSASEVAQAEDPTLLAMAWNAANAFAAWVAAGMPRRSAAEIEATFAICQRCPQFDLPSSSCRRCGCGCSSAESVLNKITLATEHCPDGHW